MHKYLHGKLLISKINFPSSSYNVYHHNLYFIMVWYAYYKNINLNVDNINIYQYF